MKKFAGRNWWATPSHLIDKKEIEAIAKGGEEFVLNNFDYPFEAELQNCVDAIGYATRGRIQNEKDIELERNAYAAKAAIEAARRP